MIGRIKVTAAGDNSPIWINPQFISFFTPITPNLCHNIGADPEGIIPNSTLLMIAGSAIQVKDTTAEINSALDRLRGKLEDSVIKLKKKAERETWQDEDSDSFSDEEEE